MIDTPFLTIVVMAAIAALGWLLRLTGRVATLETKSAENAARIAEVDNRHEVLAKELRHAVGELTSAVSELKAIVGLLRERLR